MVVTGGCLCGEVRFEVRAAPLFVCICHCRSCRKATGGAMVPWVTFNESDVVFTRGDTHAYTSSPGVTRGHCARCGSSMWYRHQRRAGQIDLIAQCLDDPAQFRPMVHIWVEDKLPWITIADGLPQYMKTISS